MRPVVHRLWLFLRKRSEKKKTTERLLGALHATEKLDKALRKLEAIGKRFREMTETMVPPVGMATADKMYLELLEWIRSTCEVMTGLQELVQQAENIMHFETFMDDLKHLDKELYEFVRMLARANKNGAVDPTEFPTSSPYSSLRRSTRGSPKPSRTR